MTFLQMALSLLLTVLQLALVLFVAPLLSGVRLSLSARMAGAGAQPVLRRWFLISRAWKIAPVIHETDGPTLIEQFLPAYIGPLSFAAALCAALLVPAFSFGLLTDSWADLLLVGMLLFAARLCGLLPALTQTAETATGAYRQAVASALILPSLFLVAVLLFSAGATTNLAIVLSGLSHGNPLADGAPFVLGGVALLAAVDPLPKAETREQGSNDALRMLASDLVALTWLTLAGDLMWPGSLARVAENQTLLAGVGAFFMGVLCWLLRCVLLATVISAGRALAIGPIAAARLRGAAALLMALLALQLLTAARLTPPADPDAAAVEEGGAP